MAYSSSNMTFYLYEDYQVLRPSVNVNCPALPLRHVHSEVLMPHNDTLEAEMHPPSARCTHLLLHHDQHENVLAACLPLDRSSTKTKQEEEKKKKKMYTGGRQPHREECALCWWASPVSPQDAVHFLGGLQVEDSG